MAEIVTKISDTEVQIVTTITLKELKERKAKIEASFDKVSLAERKKKTLEGIDKRITQITALGVVEAKV